MSPLLEIKDLTIDFQSESGTTRAVDGISLHLDRGETLGIVGESGSGKSVTALSVMRLLPMPPARIVGGEIIYHRQDTAVDLLQLPDPAMQRIRGADIAMIFQEPMTSLNPVFRCGHQVTEALQLHRKMDYASAKSATLQLFERVKLPDPTRIFDAYPHQISGGQKQRVMIAMAMSCNPQILIADEPTTALDVTVQKAILDLMRELREESGLSMLFISHDLGVISEICDRVAVMFRGKIVEEGPAQQILENPQHPYTRGLVACRPSLHRRLHRMPTVPDFLENKNFEAKGVTPAEMEARQTALYAQKPLLEVKNLLVHYPKKKNWLGRPVDWLHAVDDVSFEVYPGETFGLAGESGCGKTTLGRAIARLTEAHSGQVFYKGVDLPPLSPEDFQPFRREIQVVFQDPYASLNPRMSVGDAVMEPMQVHRLHENDRIRRQKTIELLETVGLQADHFQRYPHEFSGGQRQRICVARALALQPQLLVCDEMVSALDVSVQATVLNLLMELREKFGLTYLFISHDLSVIKQMCDRVLIMNRGQVEEVGFPDEVYQNPEKEYVRRLIEAIPGGF
jgi:peptide/nickel transport system ATP-binding protein